ncbi:MAG: hypothetical protein AAB673_02090, partial [Patescibacteria group bacterium]
MLWRFLLFLMTGVLLVIIDTGFLAFLPLPFSALNLITAVLLFLLFLNVRFSTVIFLALWTGFLTELMNTTPFGIFSISLIITLTLSEIIFTYIFTNRSLPALLALGVFSTLIFRTVFFLGALLASVKLTILSFSSLDYFSATFWEL